MSRPQPFALSPDRRDIPLDALAARIANELATLAGLSFEVQSALSLCHFSNHTDPDAIRGLQGIDLITQALEDLERLMRAVSAELTAEVKIPVAPLFSDLKLHDLIGVLDPACNPEEPRRCEVGDVQWL